MNAEAQPRPVLRPLLGLAGLLLLAGTIAEIAVHGGATIWSGLLGLIGPDLAFAAGAGQPHGHGLLPRRAVPAYNFLHRPWLPLIMLAVVSFDGQTGPQAAPEALVRTREEKEAGPCQPWN